MLAALLVQELLAVRLTSGHLWSLRLNQVNLWSPDATSQYTDAHKKAAEALYGADGWHVMTTKHGSGPSWRWKQADFLNEDSSAWLRSQCFHLRVSDYLPQYLSLLLNLQVQVRYK